MISPSHLQPDQGEASPGRKQLRCLFHVQLDRPIRFHSVTDLANVRGARVGASSSDWLGLGAVAATGCRRGLKTYPALVRSNTAASSAGHARCHKQSSIDLIRSRTDAPILDTPIQFKLYLHSNSLTNGIQLAYSGIQNVRPPTHISRTGMQPMRRQRLLFPLRPSSTAIACIQL